MTTATVCLIAKDEGPYLVEWLAHYVTLGFDRIVLYDNGSSDATAEIVRACAEVEPRIELRNWPDRPGKIAQNSAYADALELAKTEWIAFFDADELLVLNKDNSIHEFLGRYGSDAGAVAINWLMFGSSGEKYYRSELQSRRFRMCGFKNTIKSIARVGVARAPIDPKVPFAHCVELSEGYYFNDKQERVEFVTPTKTAAVSYEFAQLNHYVVRSAQEFEWKKIRGLVHRVPGDIRGARDENFWLANDSNKSYRKESDAVDRWVAKSDALRARLAARLAQEGIGLAEELVPGDRHE